MHASTRRLAVMTFGALALALLVPASAGAQGRRGHGHPVVLAQARRGRRGPARGRRSAPLATPLASHASRPGVVDVSSSPVGAFVYVDRHFDRSRGTTPVTIELAPGTYEVTLRIEGHEEVTRLVTVDAGSRTQVDVDLPSTLGGAHETAVAARTDSDVRPEPRDADRAPAASSISASSDSETGLRQRVETRTGPRGGTVLGLAAVFVGPVNQPQALASGTAWAASLGVALDEARTLRFGIDLTIAPPNGVLWIFDGAAGIEYALHAGDSVELSARLGLGAGAFSMQASGYQLVPGMYPDMFVRASVGATFWASRGFAIRAGFGLDRFFVVSTPESVEPNAPLRYRADIGVAVAL